MSQYTYQPAAPAAQSNGLGIAGFVCSLVGLLFTGGLLSPIGLILSLVALGRQPRGFAVAGLVLGLLGMCGWGLAWLVAGAAILAALGMAVAAVALAAIAEPQKAEVTADMVIMAATIEAERDRTGTVPLDLDGIGLEGNMLIDPWGNPYRLVVDADGRDFDILSDGQDGQANTPDDISFHNLDALWESPGAVQITTRGEGDGEVRVKVGSRTLTVIGDDDGGQVRLDTGEKVIEIRGDDTGGDVIIHDSSTGTSENDEPSGSEAAEEPTGAPPPDPGPR
ncbi:MAG: type II secretion system protein GspG [Planctomycetota bacterium]|jgi:hypothetical protein